MVNPSNHKVTNDANMQTTPHRHDRLRLHGPGPFECLSPRQQLLRPRIRTGAASRLCPRRRPRPSEFADKWGYESIETDWQKLLERKDIDAIDICMPNNLHQEIAIAAAEAGKMILCEKPLAMNAAEGEKMVDAVEKAGVANIVWYNYRRVPAVTLAKQLIDEGQLGPHLPLPRQLPAGLDDLRRPAARRRRPVAARRDSRRQRRHRRPAGPLHRHGHSGSTARSRASPR